MEMEPARERKKKKAREGDVCMKAARSDKGKGCCRVPDRERKEGEREGVVADFQDLGRGRGSMDHDACS